MNISIPINRRRFPTLLVFSLLLTIVVAVILKNAIANGLLSYGSLNWLFLGGPLYYTLVSLAEYGKTLFDKKARLKVTDEGIDDNLSIFSGGKIAWAEIEGVGIHRVRKVDLLVIKLIDPDKWIAGQPSWKRHVLKKFVRKWGAPIVISQQRVDFDLQKLGQTLALRIASRP